MQLASMTDWFLHTDEPEGQWDGNGLNQSQDEVSFCQVVSGLSLWNQGPHQALWSQLLTEITNHHLPMLGSEMHVAWQRPCHKAADADRHTASASGIFPHLRLICNPNGWRDPSTPHSRSPVAIPVTLERLFFLGTLLSLQLIRGKGGNSSTNIKSEFKIWLSPNTHTQSKISFSPGYPFIHIHPGEWQAGLPHRVDKRL